MRSFSVQIMTTGCAGCHEGFDSRAHMGLTRLQRLPMAHCCVSAYLMAPLLEGAEFLEGLYRLWAGGGSIAVRENYVAVHRMWK